VTDSEVRLHVKLSLLMTPLRTPLVHRIEDKFARLFPEPKAGAKRPHKKTTLPAR